MPVVLQGLRIAPGRLIKVSMEIVSVNAWGGKVWDALASWVPQQQGRVVCLQEMIRAPQPSPDWLYYRDPYRELEQRADLFADVSRMLPDHQARFAPAARGYLEDADGARVLSEHGLGQWVPRDLIIAEHLQGFVHGGFRLHGWGEEPVPRTMQVSRICDPASGRFVVVGHVHGLRDPSGKGDTPARHQQARRIVAHLEHLRQSGDIVVLMGDLNLLPDSESFEIFARIGLVDLISEFGITDTRTALYEKPQRFADYALVSDPGAVADFSVPAEPVISDHRALHMTLDLGA